MTKRTTVALVLVVVAVGTGVTRHLLGHRPVRGEVAGVEVFVRLGGEWGSAPMLAGDRLKHGDSIGLDVVPSRSTSVGIWFVDANRKVSRAQYWPRGTDHTPVALARNHSIELPHAMDVEGFACVDTAVIVAPDVAPDAVEATEAKLRRGEFPSPAFVYLLRCR